MTTFTEGRHAAACVLSEAAGTRSRDNLTIAESQSIIPGTVLGKVVTNAGAVTVGNPTLAGTGDGTLTKANPAYGAGVQEGTYKIRCTEKTADSGQFLVIRPDGTVDGVAVVGTAYDGQVKFSIADGATDFAQNSEFSLAVTIAASDAEGQYKALDLSATDGTEIAAAVALYQATTGAGETAKIAGLTRDCEVNGNELDWPDAITDDEKAAAVAQLASAGIIVR